MSNSLARAWSLAVVVLLGLVACSSSDDTKVDSAAVAAQPTTEDATSPTAVTVPITDVKARTSATTTADTEALVATSLSDPPLFSFTSALASTIDIDQSTLDYPSYTEVSDSTGILTAEIPAVWTSIANTPVPRPDGEPIAQIAASTNLSEFGQSPGVAGIAIMSAPGEMDPHEVAQDMGIQAGTCKNEGTVTDFDDGTNEGTYRVQIDCGGSTFDVVNVAFVSIDGSSPLVAIVIKVFTQADLAALDRAYTTLSKAP